RPPPALDRRRYREIDDTGEIEQVEDRRRGRVELLQQDLTEQWPVQCVAHRTEPDRIDADEHDRRRQIRQEIDPHHRGLISGPASANPGQDTRTIGSQSPTPVARPWAASPRPSTR